MPNTKKYVAVDYGTSRVGLAVSYATLAEPLEVVLTEKALQRIWSVILEHGITNVLVGLPEGKMAPLVNDFIQQLRFLVPATTVIETIDETLSSREVHRKQFEAKKSLAQRKQPMDHYAAAEMLQWYLDTRSNESE